MSVHYPAVFEPDEGGGFFVRFVDIEGAMTDGDTLEEALFNAAEALSGVLGSLLDDNQPIPDPSPAVAGAVLIAPDARTQAALLVRKARGERSLADLARALETSWPSARRLEDPRHSPTLRQLEKAAAALGKRLILALD